MLKRFIKTGYFMQSWHTAQSQSVGLSDDPEHHVPLSLVLSWNIIAVFPTFNKPQICFQMMKLYLAWTTCAACSKNRNKADLKLRFNIPSCITVRSLPWCRFMVPARKWNYSLQSLKMSIFEMGWSQIPFSVLTASIFSHLTFWQSENVQRLLRRHSEERLPF